MTMFGLRDGAQFHLAHGAEGPIVPIHAPADHTVTHWERLDGDLRAFIQA